MNIDFKLLPEAVGTAKANSKSSILATLAEKFARGYDLDAADVLQGIQHRESLGSTGFGRGVAIPHSRIDGLRRPVAAFLRLESPIAFDAVDGIPVDIVFGLLSPKSSGASHLHALAAISRMMRVESTRDALMEAPGVEAIYGLLCNVSDRDAA